MSEPAAPTEAVGAEAFRALMSRWASGVSVVTAREAEVDSGLTVNAFLSVSLHPPTVLISLTHDADSTPVILRTRRFVVNLLATGQRALSERFALAIPGPEKFAGVPVHRAGGGPARLDGALAAFECDVERAIPIADHQLILGRVVELESGPDGAPLVFYRSRYAEAEGAETLRLPARRP